MRYLIGTFKRGEAHRYEGPFPCCALCAESIKSGSLRSVGEDDLDVEGLEVDSDDYSEFVESEMDPSDFKFWMTCFFCKIAAFLETRTQQGTSTQEST